MIGKYGIEVIVIRNAFADWANGESAILKTVKMIRVDKMSQEGSKVILGDVPEGGQCEDSLS